MICQIQCDNNVLNVENSTIPLSYKYLQDIAQIEQN